MAYKAQKIIIVDGYNVLRTSPKYADIAGKSPNFKDWSSEVLNAARESLLNDLALLTDKNTKGIIVYDAAGRYDKLEQKTNHVANIEILFSQPGQSADAAIEEIVFNAREKGHIVTVVTSDLQIQSSTMNKGVTRMSSREFGNYAREEKQDIKINNKDHAHFSASIEKQVDSNTAKKLARLRDSLQ